MQQQVTSADRLREIHEQLQEGVRILTTSEDWQHALAFAARFHSYSFGNALLIQRQRPEASYVAGFHRWLELGRHVRKGEHGIAILAPIVVRKHDTETDETTERVVRLFKVAHVFDVAQTDGDELPRTVFADRLVGGADRERELYALLAEVMQADGWTVTRTSADAIDAYSLAANGITGYASRAVMIRDDLSPAQALKTLAHERAHTLLHNGTTANRELIECEAESAAYVVLSALGIDAGAYSFGYVAGWSKGDAKVVQAAGRSALAAAQTILAAVSTQ
jgi:antirestriction protein ArdC